MTLTVPYDFVYPNNFPLLYKRAGRFGDFGQLKS